MLKKRKARGGWIKHIPGPNIKYPVRDIYQMNEPNWMGIVPAIVDKHKLSEAGTLLAKRRGQVATYLRNSRNLDSIKKQVLNIRAKLPKYPVPQARKYNPRTFPIVILPKKRIEKKIIEKKKIEKKKSLEKQWGDTTKQKQIGPHTFLRRKKERELNLKQASELKKLQEYYNKKVRNKPFQGRSEISFKKKK